MNPSCWIRAALPTLRRANSRSTSALSQVSTVADPAVTHAPYGSAHIATRQARHTGQPATCRGSVFSAFVVSNIGSVALAHNAANRRAQNTHRRNTPPGGPGAH